MFGWQDRQQNVVDFRRRLQSLSKNKGGLSRPGQAREIRVLSTGMSHIQLFIYLTTTEGNTSLFFACLFSVPSKVVCKEVIWNMRAYWEVEFSGWVVIGATYEGAGRRASSGPSGLGENEESWGLCWSGTQYEIWFNGIKKDITDVPFCSTIGVYLDQPAGIISFYAVTGEGAEQEAQLLHKVETSMDQRILPGFWIGIQSSCTILKIPEWNVTFYLFNQQMSGIVWDHMHHFSSSLDDKLSKCLLEKYVCIVLCIIVYWYSFIVAQINKSLL